MRDSVARGHVERKSRPKAARKHGAGGGRSALRAQQLLAQGQDAQQVMVELAHRLTNKLIHSSTEALRQAGETGDRETLAILSQSLGLDNP